MRCNTRHLEPLAEGDKRRARVKDGGGAPAPREADTPRCAGARGIAALLFAAGVAACASSATKQQADTDHSQSWRPWATSDPDPLVGLAVIPEAPDSPVTT